MAGKLLDAMDRQHGQPLFSMNVDRERNLLRELIPRSRDAADASR
ncbi:MAG TPA: hypothetical protein VN903_40140 [Polyangia bacterium]|nr:hypothetical protein [Polyangia bacterium]